MHPLYFSCNLYWLCQDVLSVPFSFCQQTAESKQLALFFKFNSASCIFFAKYGNFILYIYEKAWDMYFCVTHSHRSPRKSQQSPFLPWHLHTNNNGRRSCLSSSCTKEITLPWLDGENKGNFSACLAHSTSSIEISSPGSESRKDILYEPCSTLWFTSHWLSQHPVSFPGKLGSPLRCHVHKNEHGI